MSACLAQPTVDTLRRLADVLGVSSDYLMEGSVEETAKASFDDRELLQQFKEVDRLPEEKKALIKRVLDALLVKENYENWLFKGMDGAKLHALIDMLPESTLGNAASYLKNLKAEAEAPPLTDEDMAAIERGLAELDRGEWLSHEEVGERIRHAD